MTDDELRLIIQDEVSDTIIEKTNEMILSYDDAIYESDMYKSGTCYIAIFNARRSSIIDEAFSYRTSMINLVDYFPLNELEYLSNDIFRFLQEIDTQFNKLICDIKEGNIITDKELRVIIKDDIDDTIMKKMNEIITRYDNNIYEFCICKSNLSCVSVFNARKSSIIDDMYLYKSIMIDLVDDFSLNDLEHLSNDVFRFLQKVDTQFNKLICDIVKV